MPYNGKMEKRVYVKVPEQLLKDFDRACEANHRTRSEILRRAMLKYVRETKKRKDQENEKDRSSHRSKSRLLEQIGEF
mgnify:CR=1 FL=1